MSRGEPLPGGYTVGEKVFYTGPSHTISDEYKLVHGKQGKVMGPAVSESHKGNGVAVLFSGNKGKIECLLIQVSRDPPPPLPGGYKVGDKVSFTGASQTASNGDKWVHGQQGEVMGPPVSWSHKGKGVAVLFPGNKGNVQCYLTELSRNAPPPLPGGYKVGEKVFYTGSSQTFADGDKLVHGQQGEVVGPATGENTKGRGVAVLFPGNKGNVNCYLTTVSRDAPPALPGAAADQEEVAVVGERTFAQRDAECRKRAIDLEAETPRKRGRGAAAALEERVVSARSVCTAAVDKRVRALIQPAIDQWVAEEIDAAELDRRKAEAREKATAEHAQLTELERASADYTEAVSARTKAEAALATSEAAEDAAEAKLEAVLRGLERGQPGPSGVNKAEAGKEVESKIEAAAEAASFSAAMDAAMDAAAAAAAEKDSEPLSSILARRPSAPGPTPHLPPAPTLTPTPAPAPAPERQAEGQVLQQAQELVRRRQIGQIKAAIAHARQQLVSNNADHVTIMGMNVNANPALARKRDDKVREILAKRARIERVIEQLFEKLPPGDHEA